MGWLLGVDVGGMFTDFYPVNTETGGLTVHEAPSLLEDSSKTIISGLNSLPARKGMVAAEFERFRFRANSIWIGSI